MPFLTDIDPRAEVKGSRDPLGLVPVWAAFGRKVVGNLSTVSDSVRGYTTLLLGYHLAREVNERAREDGEGTLEPFIRFEQLAGYCRLRFLKDGDFRGVEKARQRLEESARVPLSAEPGYQILASQKTYGLWGLYSVPGRDSGLLDRREALLTPAAEEFVERNYLAALERRGFPGGQALVEVLRSRRRDVDLDGGQGKLGEALAGLFKPKFSEAERAFYTHHLVHGGDEDRTGGLQKQLAALLAALPWDEGFGRESLREVLRRARKEGLDALAEALDRIDRLEAVIAPAGYAFGFLLARSGQEPGAVAREIAQSWGRRVPGVEAGRFAELGAEIEAAYGREGAGARWVEVARGFTEGRYEEALRHLVDLNAEVMLARNGSAPWVRLTKGRLEVRYLDESGALPAAEDLPHLWRNTYFLNSLHRVVATLGGG